MNYENSETFQKLLFEKLSKVQEKQSKNEALTDEEFAFLLMSSVLEEED